MLRRALLCSLICVLPLTSADPVFPYGAVYFRKSNPPEEDWARDHKNAAKLGMNTFRHWFMWSSIEVAPGKYDWRDYDRMMDLAAENGIKVVIAEMVTAVPEWLFSRHPHARYQGSDGTVINSQSGGSSSTGGFPGLCLDNEEVKEAAGRFLKALVEHYKDHPALWAYDLWNEHSYSGGTPQRMYCYCDASQAKFRSWLKTKYNTVENLGKAWYRYSYADWNNVKPPPNLAGYPESLDWLEYRVDNQMDLLKWRVDLVRNLDKRSKITAHGVASTLEALPTSTNDEWRSAEQVEVWGFTWVASRKGNEAWKQFHAVDLTRAGSRGKPFWHAEAQAGPLWMQPQVIGRAREDGRITDEKDVRIWNMISMAGGATGILYPRYRPLLDGPLFGAFGPMAMDGSSTPRSEMAGSVARWANEQKELWTSKPVKGDVGIVFVPESETFAYVQQGSTQHYAESIRGAYQAFFDSNIQADFVRIDHLGEYPMVYLPYPIHLKSETAKKLIEYVEQGGILVSEGLPGYFGDRGKAGVVQPNFGMDRMFGAKESDVEFTPDLLEGLTLQVRNSTISGRYFRQEYTAAGGQVVGTYANGKPAAIEHKLGKGRVLLIGTFPGSGYFLHHSAGTRNFFAGLLPWAGIKQKVVVNSPAIKARLHQGPGGTYLWVLNPARTPAKVLVRLEPQLGSFSKARDIWTPANQVKFTGRQIDVTVGDRNASVIQLTP